MTRTERRILAAGAAIALLIMVSYGLKRLIESTAATLATVGDTGVHADGFPWAPVLVIGSLLLLRVAFKAGQYHRGYMHARGIRRSHWAAIGGGHK